MRLYINSRQTDPLSLPDVRDWLDQKPLTVTTSGTTGYPKTVTHSHELMQQVVKANVSTMGHHSKSKLFSILSPNGIGYQALSVYCAIEADCDLYLETFDFKTYIDRIHEVRPTYTILPPNLYRVMSRRPNWKDLDLSSLETFLMGSDFTPEGALDELRSHGPDRVVNAYGSTEAPPFVMVSEEENSYSIEDTSPNCQIAISDRNTLLCKWSGQDEWWDSEDLLEGTLDGFKMKGRERNMFKQDRVRVYPEEAEKVATESGAELALCRQENSYAVLYFVGPMDKDKVLKKLNHIPRLRIRQVDEIKVDNNLRKVIRNQILE